jgi:GDP-4-dehydro-6-deoxy-D-mannose reductase
MGTQLRALVTGGNGFVGRYLTAELRGRGFETVVAGHSPDGGDFDVALDLRDPARISQVVAEARPTVVFHLAAQAFVPRATADPIETYDINVMGTARLVDAVRRLPPGERPLLMFASSAEIYGTHEAAELPLRETAQPLPATPYAASKLAGEGIVMASARTYGFPTIVTRAFNHIGPGQSHRFAVAGFARRLAAIAAGGAPLLPVGNLDTMRDFLDVRDVVRAYVDLALRGSAGEIYNVCSGAATRMSDVLRQLVMAARVGVEIREDPSLVRAADVRVVYGDNAKLKAATGWEPTYSLAQSLRDVYAAARAAEDAAPV